MPVGTYTIIHTHDNRKLLELSIKKKKLFASIIAVFSKNVFWHYRSRSTFNVLFSFKKKILNSAFYIYRYSYRYFFFWLPDRFSRCKHNVGSSNYEYIAIRQPVYNVLGEKRDRFIQRIKFPSDGRVLCACNSSSTFTVQLSDKCRWSRPFRIDPAA